jgi:galactokinase
MAKIKSLNEKINGGNNPFFQELYGVDSSALKEQAHRYASLMSDFGKTYGTDDVQLFTSPGRTEIG